MSGEMSFSQYADKHMAEEGYVSKVINGKTYSIKLLDAMPAFVTGLQLVRAFLPALGGFLDGAKREGLVLPEEESLFAETAMLLVSQLDKVNLAEVVSYLLQDARCDKQTFDYNSHFRGKIGDFLSLVEFALRANFSDFFTGYLKEKGLSLQSLREKMPGDISLAE